jgi:hypothetical protein
MAQERTLFGRRRDADGFWGPYAGDPGRQSRAFKFEDPREDELEGDGVSASDHVLAP